MVHVVVLAVALLGGELAAASEPSSLFADSFVSSQLAEQSKHQPVAHAQPPVAQPVPKPSVAQPVAQPAAQPATQPLAQPVVQLNVPPAVLAPAPPVGRKTQPEAEKLPQEAFVDAAQKPPAVTQAASNQQQVEVALQAAAAEKEEVQVALQVASDQKEQVQVALQAATEQKEQVVAALDAASNQKDQAQVAFQAVSRQGAHAETHPSDVAASAVVGIAVVTAATTQTGNAQAALQAATDQKEQVQVALQAAVEQKDQVQVALQAASNEKVQVQAALKAASEQQAEVQAQAVAALQNGVSNTAAGAVGSNHGGIPVAVAAAAAAAVAAPPVDVALAAATATTGFWFAMQYYMPGLASVLVAINYGSIIKAMCMIGNVMVQLSPYPQVKRWESRGCTGEADAAPYVAIAFGGWQWSFYGLFAYFVTQRSGFLILVHSNCLGALMGTYYSVMFYRHCRSLASLNSMQRYLSGVMTLVAFQVCAVCVLPVVRALFLTGLISSFCSFVGATSMLVTVPQVIRSKDSQSISGPFVVTNILSAFTWCVCGWMLEDPLVMGPNMFALMCSTCCFYLKQKYPSDDNATKGQNLDNALEAGKSLPEVALPSKGQATEYTPIMKAMCASSKAASVLKTMATTSTPEVLLSKTMGDEEYGAEVSQTFSHGDGGSGGTF